MNKKKEMVICVGMRNRVCGKPRRQKWERPQQSQQERPQQSQQERLSQSQQERPSQSQQERLSQSQQERPQQSQQERQQQSQQERPQQSQQERPSQSQQERLSQSQQERLSQSQQERPLQSQQERPLQSQQERPLQSQQERPLQSQQERPLQSQQERPLQSQQERPLQSQQERPLQSQQERPQQERPQQSQQEGPLQSQQERPLHTQQEYETTKCFSASFRSTVVKDRRSHNDGNRESVKQQPVVAKMIKPKLRKRDPKSKTCEVLERMLKPNREAGNCVTKNPGDKALTKPYSRAKRISGRSEPVRTPQAKQKSENEKKEVSDFERESTRRRRINILREKTRDAGTRLATKTYKNGDDGCKSHLHTLHHGLYVSPPTPAYTPLTNKGKCPDKYGQQSPKGAPHSPLRKRALINMESSEIWNEVSPKRARYSTAHHKIDSNSQMEHGENRYKRSFTSQMEHRQKRRKIPSAIHAEKTSAGYGKLTTKDLPKGAEDARSTKPITEDLPKGSEDVRSATATTKDLAKGTEDARSTKPLKGICRQPGNLSSDRGKKKRVRFGVGGEWSASSPCSSLTSSPPPRPEEDLDDCCLGSTPTAGPHRNTPSPTPAHHVHQLNCMAPNDGSGVRMGRKGGHDGDQLMGRFGPGGQVGHTPHKDRPPDAAHLPVRATRRTAPHHAAHRRRRVQVVQDRKRSGEEVTLGVERRTKLARALSPPSPINGVRRLNGCVNGSVNGSVNGEAVALLQRLASLSGVGEKRVSPANHAINHIVNHAIKHTNNHAINHAINHANHGLTKDSLQNGVGHILSKNGIKCLNGSVKGRVVGGVRPERVNGVRRVVGEELRRKAAHLTNNNIEPPSARLPTTPTKLTHPADHSPTLAKRASQEIPHHPPQGLTLSCDVGVTPPALCSRAAHQPPPLSPTAARCSAKSSPPPAHTTPCATKSRSSSASSGVGSSAPSSGTSTPTPTVRFPVPEKKEGADVCRWRHCDVTLDPTTSLLEHIQAVHVEGQLEAESFRCLWVGCKVYDKASCSVSWLERHVLTHGGHKPFKCIVEGCGQRFTSQTALGRHVNHHFSTATAAPTPRPPTQPSPSKLIRKNGRKCRYRKKPWSAARMFDMFDVGVMECVQWRLMSVTQIQHGGAMQTSGQTFTLIPQVLARRTCSKGVTEVLVRWSPPGVLADEWVDMDELEERRSVPLEQLSPEAKQAVTQLCYPSLARPQKHRRKRPSCPKSLSLDLSKAV